MCFTFHLEWNSYELSDIYICVYIFAHLFVSEMEYSARHLHIVCVLLNCWLILLLSNALTCIGGVIIPGICVFVHVVNAVAVESVEWPYSHLSMSVKNAVWKNNNIHSTSKQMLNLDVFAQLSFKLKLLYIYNLLYFHWFFTWFWMTNDACGIKWNKS